MFKRLGAAILLVEDLEKSINFYRDILELKIKNQSSDWVEFQNEAQGAVLALHPARIKQKGFSNIQEKLLSAGNSPSSLHVHRYKFSLRRLIRFAQEQCVFSDRELVCNF